MAAEKAGWAISIILLGSIGGAIVGPELATRSPGWNPDQPYHGALLAMAGLYALAMGLLLLTRNPASAGEAASHEAGRSLA